ncbi:MAG: DUF6985 domain-containing protein [Isosphaeraceae bacterium]
MNEAIHTPPFPSLRWDDHFWAGEIALPSWAGYQSRRGPYASVNSPRPSDGTVRLTVSSMDDDSRARPVPEQAVALEYLMDNEASVAASIGEALVKHYGVAKAAYLDDYDEEDAEILPDVTEPRQLRPLLGLHAVHVLAVVHDGAAYIGFEFGCVWDDEHGAGVMTHRGRIVAAGQAHVSFMAWIARQDADHTPKPD